MERKIIGKIVNTFQLKGKIKVTLLTDNYEDRFKVGKEIYIKDDNGKDKKYIISSMTLLNPKVVAISLKGYDDINDVEFLINKDIYEDVSIDDDCYFYDDLLKMNVIKTDGSVVGKVSKIIKMKNIDYLIVDNLYIPFQIDRFIESVDKNKLEIHLTKLGDEVTK